MCALRALARRGLRKRASAALSSARSYLPEESTPKKSTGGLHHLGWQLASNYSVLAHLVDMSADDVLREAEALGFDAARAGRLRDLFDHYDVDQRRALDQNEIECMIVELGHKADHSRARALQEEFGDVSRDDGADGRSVSFSAFLRLVAKLQL